MYAYKRAQLLAFLDKYKDLPKQGSLDWKNNRQFTIGGSEMATVMGLNPYNDISDLVMTKLGWKPFVNTTATNWGKLFEPAAQILLEQLFKCILYETGSLPGCIPHTSYSPDGFAVVETSVIKELINKKIIPPHELVGDAQTVVFEIKSPYSRNPSSQPPAYYMPQPLSALSHFDFLDIAYFVDVAFRLCTVEDLPDETSYFKYQSDKNVSFTEVLYRGTIGFAVDVGGEVSTNMLDLCTQPDKLQRIIESSANEKFKTYYFNIDEDVEVSKSKLAEICNKELLSCLGILTYKIFKCVITPIHRQPNFVQEYQEEINQVIATIDEIRNSADPLATFNEIFPEP